MQETCCQVFVHDKDARQQTLVAPKHELLSAVQALSSRGWMHKGTTWKVKLCCQASRTTRKLAQKPCVCQACTAAELDPICLLSS